VPLPTGTWQAFVNGSEGPLDITTVEPTGRVSGSMLLPGLEDPQLPGLRDIVGLWEEASSSLMFFWLMGQTVFTGYHFQSPASAEEGVDITHTLAGHCVVTPDFGKRDLFAVTARRHHFGWFAQLTQVV
jgi:hypothetical protein